MGITRGITEFWGGLTGSRAGQVALRRARGRWWTVGLFKDSENGKPILITLISEASET